jgi:RNA polymerase sigma-70 factor (ECF subfamily)
MTYEDRIVLAVGRARAQEQDDVLSVLIRQHATFVYRIAYSVLRDSQDAEDVAQDTFIRVMKNIAELPLVRDERSWLARIAWRLALTRSAKRRRKRTLEVDMREESRILPMQGPRTDESAELIRVIEQLTASLPAPLRHPLVLSAIEEVDNREIARILNISETTVRTRIHRARKLLREKLRSIMGKDHAW